MSNPISTGRIEPTESEPASHRRRGPRRWRAVAAVLACVLVSLAIWYATSDRYEPSIPPPAPLPVPNALDTYKAAAQAMEKSGVLGTAFPAGLVRPPSPQGEAIAVSQARPLLESLRAAMKQPCRMPRADGGWQSTSYTYEISRLHFLLVAEADVRERNGDYAGELDTALDMDQLGLDMERGGIAVHALSASSLQLRAQILMGRAIGHLTAAECDRASARLASLIRERPRPADVVREQQYVTLASMMKMSGSEAFGDWSLAGRRVPTPRAIRDPINTARWRAHRSQTLRQLEAYFTALARQAELPAWRRSPVPLANDPVARTADYNYLLALDDALETRNRLCLCALAIRAIRLRQGRLPGSLGEAGLREELVTDTYTGRPFVYTISGRDYLLYSIGPDGRDDGGRSIDSIDYANPVGPGDIGLSAYRSAPSPAFRASFAPFSQPVPHMLRETGPPPR